MARETKAQREQRHAEEQAAVLADRENSYKDRLMLALYRTSSLGLPIKVERVYGDSYLFVIHPNDRDWRSDEFEVYPDYDVSSYDNLESLEGFLDHKEYEASEAKRKHQLRVNALSKLTAEERAELGL